MSQVTVEDLLDAPVGRTIARIASMAYAGLFIASFMGLTEAFFIARLGADQLAAFGLTFSTYGLIFGLSLALGAGVRATVSQSLGRGDRETAALTVTAACLWLVPIFAVLGIVGALFDREVYELSGASAVYVASAKTFMLPVWCLTPAVGVAVVVTSALQATGNLKASLWSIAAILPSNLVLSPILMFGFGPLPPLGMLGAGIAAALAWLICGGLGMLFLKRAQLLGSVHSAKQVIDIMRPVLRVALPASVHQLTVPISMTMITSIVASLGPAAIAAFAALARIADFVIMGNNALGTGVHVVAGTCVGAGRHERVPGVVTTGAMLSFAWGLACALVFGVLAEPVAHVIAGDVKVAALVGQFLRSASVSYAFMASYFVIAGAMSAIHRPREGLVMSLLGTFGLQIPIMYVCTHRWGFSGYCLSAVATHVATLTMGVAWLRYDKLLDLSGLRGVAREVERAL